MSLPGGMGTASANAFFTPVLDLSMALFDQPQSVLWLVQLVVGSLTAVLVCRLAGMLFGRWTGVVSGLVVASYGPMITATGRFDSVVWLAMLLTAGLLLLAKEADRAWLIGVCLGLVAGAMLQTIPTAISAFWWICRCRGRKHGYHFASTWLACFILVSHSAEEMIYLPSPAVWADVGLWPQILSAPWHAVEWGGQGNPYRAVQDTVVSWLMWNHGVAFPFGILGPLAVMGIFRLWRRRTDDSLNALAFWLAAANIIGVCILGGDTQTRATALPMLVIVAADRVMTLRQDLRSRRALLFHGVAIMLLTVLFHVGGRGPHAVGTAYDYFNRGAAYERLSMNANAISEYERAVAFDVAPVEAHAALGRLHAAAGKFGSAAQAYRVALDVRPDEHTLREALATVLLRAELPSEAMEELLVLVEQMPDGERLRGVLGDARLMGGDSAGAMKEYSRMTIAEPDSARVLYNLSRLYEETGSKVEAIEGYQRLRDHAEWRVEAGWRAAVLMSDIGEIEAAEDLLELVLAEEPVNREALMGLGRLHAVAGRYSDALIHFEKLMLLEPDDYRIQFFLSKIYFRLGRESEADKAFEKYHHGKRRAEIKHTVEEDLEGILRQFGDWAQ